MSTPAIGNAEGSGASSLYLSSRPEAGVFTIEIEAPRPLAYAYMCIRKGNHRIGVEVSTEVGNDMEPEIFQKMRQEYYLQKGFWQRYSVVGLKGAQAVETSVVKLSHRLQLTAP